MSKEDTETRVVPFAGSSAVTLLKLTGYDHTAGGEKQDAFLAHSIRAGKTGQVVDTRIRKKYQWADQTSREAHDETKFQLIDSMATQHVYRLSKGTLQLVR